MNNLDQMTIDDYFREYSHFHVKKATELLQPLHTPGQDPLPDFSDATRQPFEPQAHVIAAAVKMLDETRRGMIVVGVRNRQNADGNADHPPARPAIGPQGRLQRQLPGDRALPGSP